MSEKTYGLVLDLLGLAALEGKTVTLVLETLGGDQSLDLGGLGVRLLALTLGLDLAADDVLADLFIPRRFRLVVCFQDWCGLYSYSNEGENLGKKIRHPRGSIFIIFTDDAFRPSFLFFALVGLSSPFGIFHLTLYPDCSNQHRSSE